VLRAALGRSFVLLSVGSVAGLRAAFLAHQGVVVHRVPGGRRRIPVVLGGVVLTMLALGLAAAWIPAQKALGVDPMILLREE
jgi:hypothetical protein